MAMSVIAMRRKAGNKSPDTRNIAAMIFAPTMHTHSEVENVLMCLPLDHSITHRAAAAQTHATTTSTIIINIAAIARSTAVHDIHHHQNHD